MNCARVARRWLLVFALAAAAPAAMAIEIRGQLLDAGGKPAAQVPVELWSYSGGMIARAATDATGVFRFDPADAGMYRVVVRAANVAPREARLLPLLTETELAPLQLGSQGHGWTEIVTLPVKRDDGPQRWSGRVVDAESRTAIANAFVWAEGDPSRVVRTREDGTYTATFAPSRAAAAGHLAATAGPVFALPPTEAVAGTVIDGEGRPVAGAAIRIRPAVPDRNRPWPEELPSRTTSRANGAFRLEAPPHRAYVVEASHARFAPTAVTVRDKPSAVAIVLLPGQSAFGRVTDAGASPIAGAEVRLTPATDVPRFFRDEADEDVRAAFTDGEGSFRFADLPRGPFALEVRAESFAPATRSHVPIDAGKPTDLGVIKLEPGVVLAGVVVDAEGHPLAGAVVAVYPPGPAGVRAGFFTRLAGEATSGSEGKFSIAGLRAGETVDVTARKSGYVPATLPRVELPLDRALRLVLGTGARVRGRVADEREQPIAGAAVTIKPSESLLPPSLAGQTATTGSDGTFTFGELPSGRLVLTVAAKGRIAGEPRLIEAGEGETVDGVELTLRRGAAIEGVVLTPSGTPAAGARVSLRNRPGWFASESTDAHADGEGRYRLEGVGPGLQTIHASDERYATASRELEVQPRTNRLDFRLGEGLALAGRVVDGDGRPLSGASVGIANVRGVNRSDVSGSGGAFRFAALDAGDYAVTARKSGYSSAQENVSLAGRAVEGLELRLQQGGGIVTGRISGLPAPLLAQVLVRVTESPLLTIDGMRETLADGQGMYRVEGLHAGDWMFTALHASGREARSQVTIEEAAGQTQVDLDFGGGITLSGVVRRGGEPVAGASLQVNGVNVTSSGRASTDGSGRYRIAGLEVGDYLVLIDVLQLGLMKHSQHISIAGDRQFDVDLPVARASGVVVDAVTGAALAGVSLVALGPGVPYPETVSNADGTFTFPNLGRATYKLVATLAGYEQFEGELVVPTDNASVEGLRVPLHQRR